MDFIEIIKPPKGNFFDLEILAVVELEFFSLFGFVNYLKLQPSTFQPFF
jgi:hypothetical protein